MSLISLFKNATSGIRYAREQRRLDRVEREGRAEIRAMLRRHFADVDRESMRNGERAVAEAGERQTEARP